MPTYKYELPSGATIKYKEGDEGYLQIKYKKKEIKMKTDDLGYEYSVLDKAHLFLDNNEEYHIQLTNDEEYCITLMKEDEEEEEPKKVKRITNAPDDLYNKLIKIGEAVAAGADLPPGYEQSGGRRKTRKVRKSRKVHKSRRRN